MEGTPVRIENVIDHYMKVRTKSASDANKSLDSKENLVNKVKMTERVVLHSLCFDLVVSHPYTNFKNAFVFMKGNYN